jgi:hypothetical protein
MKSYEKMQKKELIDVILALETKLNCHNGKSIVEKSTLSKKNPEQSQKKQNISSGSPGNPPFSRKGRVIGILVPVCACCKRIRNSGGSWRRPRKREWLKDKSRLVTHGICPDCAGDLLKNELEACRPKSPCGGGIYGDR